MHTLAEILQDLLRNEEINESELARRCGLKQPLLYRLSHGDNTNPTINSLRPIANYFGVSISQLIGETPLPKALQTHKTNWALLPLIDFEQAITWPNNREQIECKLKIYTDIDVSDEAYALQVCDSTMLPRFIEGTILVVDPNSQQKNRDFVIAQHQQHQQATFQQLLIEGCQRYLKPLNTAFPPQAMQEEDMVLGTVVQTKLNY
jgi:SOS-response transcriptional repressor LexA